MMLKIIIVLAASMLSAWLYRAGGQGKPYNTKFRDIGCSILWITLLITLQGSQRLKMAYILPYAIAFGLSWAALTTYFKKKGQPARWYNWALTGAGYSLAALPIAWATGHWLGFILRCLVLTIGITVWSVLINWDILEEGGRGFAITATIPLLLIY